jgi:hypothetical protein
MELALTADQTEKLQHVWGEYQTAYRDAIVKARDTQDLPRLERRKRVALVNELESNVESAFRPRVEGLLDASQKKRLMEIAIQAAGPHALVDEEVARELALTKDQRDKMIAISRRPPAEEGREAWDEHRRQQLQSEVALLTPQQKARFEALKGKPFDLK